MAELPDEPETQFKRAYLVPGLEVLAPFSGATVASTFWVDGSYSVNGQTVSVDCRDANNVSVGGGSGVVANSAWSVQVAVATPGPNSHTLIVTVTGGAGNDSSVSVDIDPTINSVGDDIDAGPADEPP